MKLGILDILFTSNTKSISNCLDLLNMNYDIINSSKQINQYDKIIFPGVGSFDLAVKVLKEKKIDKILKSKKLKPKFLCICLGMQILFSKGYENINSKGLSIINGNVTKISDKKTPKIGYSKIEFKSKDLFKDISKNSELYFMHSYGCESRGKKYETSLVKYGKKKYISSLKYKNFVGVQFHPENSKEEGLKIIKNFLNEK
tara:strand:- start:731 stop:1333 length:603 start_codon:yes stop_codon:yes gene_type:complete